MAVTYHVRVWKVERVEGKTGTSHKVRWVVDGRLRRRTFRPPSWLTVFVPTY
jgi:hypothetical protein